MLSSFRGIYSWLTGKLGCCAFHTHDIHGQLTLHDDVLGCSCIHESFGIKRLELLRDAFRLLNNENDRASDRFEVGHEVFFRDASIICNI